ncbi:MAG: beta-hydroxyacyl-ACP dehydratase [Planctomycetales bacterium]|nr:beta-hydroxyacyl-ACP dehydratase [Planctomycetales bacterium]
MTQDAILKAIPHRPPFLLLDTILEQSDNRIVCDKTFLGSEFWYDGHYPDAPITPGVLLCEAAMQAGAVLLASRVGASDGRVPVATRADDVRFKKMVKPGDTITIDVTLDDQVSNAFYLTGKVMVAGKLAARLSFACTLAEQP